MKLGPDLPNHDYLVRNIPEPLWQRANEKAKAEGRTVARVVVRLLSQYASGTDAKPFKI